MHRQENFSVFEMTDGDGNAPLRVLMECVKVWFVDRRRCFKMDISRQDFLVPEWNFMQAILQ